MGENRLAQVDIIQSVIVLRKALIWQLQGKYMPKF